MKSNKLTLTPLQANVINMQIRAEQKKNYLRYMFPWLLRDRSHLKHFISNCTIYLIEHRLVHKIKCEVWVVWGNANILIGTNKHYLMSKSVVVNEEIFEWHTRIILHHHQTSITFAIRRTLNIKTTIEVIGQLG
jgi:hypothetical protein